METVSTFDSEVNVLEGPIEEVRKWLMTMADRGEFPGSTARFKATALKSLSEVLGPDEPRDPQWLLDNIDSIARRYGVKNSTKPDTLSAYLSRAKSALEDYIAYQKNPFTWKAKVKAVPSKKSEPKKVEEQTTMPLAAAAPPSPASPPQSPAKFRDLPLQGGRRFHFSLPDDLTMEDVQRIAHHIATFATDFRSPPQTTPPPVVPATLPSRGDD
jgi:hypothetical protein